jgi:hypothetical protein
MSKPATGSTFTLNPSAQSGWVSSSSAGGYALARAGGSLQVSPGATLVVGQVFLDDGEGGFTWVCYESFLDFDTSGVTGSIVSATLSLGLNTDDSDTDFTVEARSRDWGASLTTADYVSGVLLDALTLLATLTTSGIGSTGAYKAMTESGSALRAAINQSGTTRLMLCSDRLRSGTEPSGLEVVQFDAYNHATLKPQLVVVTT